MGLYRDMKKRLPLRVIHQCLANLRDISIKKHIELEEIYGEPCQRSIGIAEGLQIAINHLDNFDPSQFAPQEQIQNFLEQIRSRDRRTQNIERKLSYIYPMRD